MRDCRRVGSARAATYAVHAKRGATPPTCNPSNLGFLRQNVGVLDKASDVTLTFDVSEPWKPDVLLNASILDGNLAGTRRRRFRGRGEAEARGAECSGGHVDHHRVPSRQGHAGAGQRVRVGRRQRPPPRPPRRPRSPEPRITVACYYFGNYHPGDPRNVKSKGKDWSEWELVKAARPRFPGHHQPNVPLWGYTDESDPKVMAQKIAAAADHGIDAFIFDWYYYNDGPFLDRPIDIGFLKAANNARLKFAFMWANHDWQEIHPYKTRHRAQGALSRRRDAGELRQDLRPRHPLLLPASVLLADRRAALLLVLRPDEADGGLRQRRGDARGARQVPREGRGRRPAGPAPERRRLGARRSCPARKPADPVKLVKDLGFDSVTSYVWIHHVPLPKLQTDYNEVRDAYFRYWNEAERKFGVPYYPNVTMGWDSSPRAHQDDEFGNFGYPFTNTIGGNTPERFKEALAMTKRRLLSEARRPAHPEHQLLERMDRRQLPRTRHQERHEVSRSRARGLRRRTGREVKAKRPRDSSSSSLFIFLFLFFIFFASFSVSCGLNPL